MNEAMNCGHIAQLAQSISQLLLKPGEEEIKKKTDDGNSGNDLFLFAVRLKLI